MPVVRPPAGLAFEPARTVIFTGTAYDLAHELVDPPDAIRVRATMVRAYFPFKQLATEWHVEYQLEFAGVPAHLIPESFERRETQAQPVGRTDDSSPEHWPTIRPDEFQEFEDVEHLEYDG